MAEVEKGHLHKLEQIPSEIEIKSLYMGFNSMIEGIREQKKAISAMSRMKTIIRLGRRVAHEVKNPLTPIKLSAEQILKALNDKNPNYEEIIKQSVNYIIDETEHLKRVSYGFLDLSRLDEINPEEFDLVDLTREELFNVTQIYSHIDFSFFVESGEGEIKTMMVTLDKVKIKQVLKNLITNSIEAIGEKKGEIRINLGKNHQNKRVTIEVVDNGGGMDKKEIERAFEVDYSTKDIGTGLGLFIVKRIVELHKGSIEILSEENKGTRVILDLPQGV
jgi:two-component system nitrogen regulation sensor histidine kinase NtrY